LLSFQSKPLKEIAPPGKGALVILLMGSTPFSLSMAQLTLLEKDFWVFQGCDHMLVHLVGQTNDFPPI